MTVSHEPARLSPETTVPACPTCGGSAVRVSGTFDGYIEGYDVFILECVNCSLRYCNRLEVPAGLYENIYAHVAVLPGYDRYVGYAARVPRHPRPLDLLASAELPYWYVRDHVQHRLPAGATVVDLGCGEGYLTYALRRAGVRCIGVDLAPTVVDRARARFGEPEWFRTVDELTRAEPLRADLVVGLELIEHVVDPVRLLEDAFALCGADGSVLLTTPNRDASPPAAVWNTDLPPVHLLWFGARALAEVAVRAGCEVTFPEAPAAMGPAHMRDGTWPALLTRSGRPSAAIVRERGVPWRARRRIARVLDRVSARLAPTPLRHIPAAEPPASVPDTLAAVFTRRTSGR